jgi:hypothetical protein
MKKNFALELEGLEGEPPQEGRKEGRKEERNKEGKRH